MVLQDDSRLLRCAATSCAEVLLRALGIRSSVVKLPITPIGIASTTIPLSTFNLFSGTPRFLFLHFQLTSATTNLLSGTPNFLFGTSIFLIATRNLLSGIPNQFIGNPHLTSLHHQLI